MGWLFAVALGLQEKRRWAVLRAFGPIAAGHAASVSAVVLVLGGPEELGILVEHASEVEGADVEHEVEVHRGVVHRAAFATGDEPIRSGGGEVVFGEVAVVGQHHPDRLAQRLHSCGGGSQRWCPAM